MAPETAGAQPSPVHREAGSAGSQGAGRTVDAQGRSVPRGLPAARRMTERHGAFLKGIPNASFKPFVLKKRVIFLQLSIGNGKSQPPRLPSVTESHAVISVKTEQRPRATLCAARGPGVLGHPQRGPPGTQSEPPA